MRARWQERQTTMPLFIDASEYTKHSTMIDVKGSIVLNNLESLTGADMLVSPIRQPATTLELIKDHLACGAIMIQIKRGFDLAGSVGPRLKDSICRMLELGAKPAQNRLLFIGTLGADKDGFSVIDGRRVQDNIPGNKYWSIQTSLDAWIERGGTVSYLSRIGLLAKWLSNMELRLSEYTVKPFAEYYPTIKPVMGPPAPNDPLQIPVKAGPPKQLIAALDGIKEKRVPLVMEYTGDRAIDAIMYLSSYGSLKRESRVPGIGPGIIRNIRAQLGLIDGEEIFVREHCDGCKCQGTNQQQAQTAQRTQRMQDSKERNVA